MPLLAKPNAELLFVLNNIVDPKRNLTGKYEVTLSASFYEPTADFPAAAKLDKIFTIGNVTGQKFEKQLKFPKVRVCWASYINFFVIPELVILSTEYSYRLC